MECKPSVWLFHTKKGHLRGFECSQFGNTPAPSSGQLLWATSASTQVKVSINKDPKAEEFLIEPLCSEGAPLPSELKPRELCVPAGFQLAAREHGLEPSFPSKRDHRAVWIWFLKQTEPAQGNSTCCSTDTATPGQLSQTPVQLRLFFCLLRRQITNNELVLPGEHLPFEHCREQGRVLSSEGQPPIQSREKLWSKPAPDHEYHRVLDTKHSW